LLPAQPLVATLGVLLARRFHLGPLTLTLGLLCLLTGILLLPALRAVSLPRLLILFLLLRGLGTFGLPSLPVGLLLLGGLGAAGLTLGLRRLSLLLLPLRAFFPFPLLLLLLFLVLFLLLRPRRGAEGGGHAEDETDAEYRSGFHGRLLGRPCAGPGTVQAERGRR